MDDRGDSVIDRPVPYPVILYFGWWPCYRANFNPLAGCLPTFATLPVFIGLYRALSNAATEAGPAVVGKRSSFISTDTIFDIKLTNFDTVVNIN